MIRCISAQPTEREPSRLTLNGHLLLLALALFIAPDAKSETAPFKYEEPKSLTATIYSLDRKTVLFKFSRHLTRSGNKLEAIREYIYPDGKLAARERVVYNSDDLQAYELHELQTGAYGRANVRPDPDNPARKVLSFEASKNPASGAPKQRSEPLRTDTLTYDMVGPFLVEHWDALMKGEEVKCRMIVAPRAETVGFRAVKESESQWQGKPIVNLRMEPTSPVIRALVDPLHFKVEKQSPHRVFEYTGRTTLKIKSGSKWEDLDALTVFDWSTVPTPTGTVTN
jgi:hypothetical protein